MSVFTDLYEAHLTIGGHDISWREIGGNAFGLASAVGGMRRKVWAWPVGIVGNVLLFTVFLFTATEAGAVACLYALALGMLYYKRIKLRDLPGILIEAAVMTTMVSGVIAVAGASGWLLAYLEFNDGAVKFVTSFSQNPTVTWTLTICLR